MKRKLTLLLLFTGLMVVGTTFAAAQAVEVKSLTLTEAVERARSNHPLIVAAKQRLAIAEAEILEAGLRPNPSINISGENFPLGPTRDGFNFGSSIDWFATYTQKFETAGKRSLRVSLAERNLEALQAEAVMVERMIVFEVKSAYQLVAIKRLRAELLRENVTNLQQVVGLNEIRVREGYTAEGDLIKVRLEVQRLEYQLKKAELDYELARISLLRAMGSSKYDSEDLNYRITEDLVYRPVVYEASVLEQAAISLPQVRAAQARVDGAEALLRLEEAKVKPDITASVGYKRHGPDNTLFAGINIPLQIYNRNRAMIERAKAEVVIAQADLSHLKNVLLSDLTSAMRSVEMNRRQVESLRADFLLRADESRSISLAAYREGAVDLLVLLDAQRVRSQAQELYFQALYDFKIAVHDLERAAGIETLPEKSESTRTVMRKSDEN